MDTNKVTKIMDTNKVTDSRKEMCKKLVDIYNRSCNTKYEATGLFGFVYLDTTVEVEKLKLKSDKNCMNAIKMCKDHICPIE